jgi:putative FmdB family regulatory protein
MPTYEFRCDTCGQVFEERRPLARAGEPAVCPADGGMAHRVFNAEAIHRAGFRARRPQRLESEPHPTDASGSPDGQPAP